MPAPTMVEATEQIRTRPAVNLTVASIAIGVSPATGSRAASAGTFPVPIVRMGTRVIVPTEPLRKLLDGNQQAAPEVEVLKTIEDFSDEELLAEMRRRMRLAAKARS